MCWQLTSLTVAALVLSGCKAANPEDKFIGREHWVNTRTDKGTVYYSYDLGSVRRADGKVFVRARKTDSIDFELSDNNQQRQAAGLPLYLGASGTLVFNCQKRTYKSVSTVADYEGGVHQRLPEMNDRIVEPNSGVEEVFDALCVAEKGLFD